MPSGLGLGAEGDAAPVVNGAVWQFTPSFAIGPGVGVSQNDSAAMTAFPVILMEWRITDAVNLGTATTPGGGAGLEAQYRAGDALTFGVGAAYEGFSFGSDSAARGGDEDNGEVPVFATATFTPNPFVSLSVTGGVSFGGGAVGARGATDRDADRPVDAAPFLGLNGSLRF
jgi:hypothetical protein